MAALYTVARGGAVVIAMVLCAAPAGAQSEEAPGTHGVPSKVRVLLRTEAVLHAADMFTTAYNLRLGGIEANPVLAPLSKRPLALTAVSSGINVLQLYTISKLYDRHPKAAIGWALILVGAETFAVTNNVRAAGQLRRARAGTR